MNSIVGLSPNSELQILRLENQVLDLEKQKSELKQKRKEEKDSQSYALAVGAVFMALGTLALSEVHHSDSEKLLSCKSLSACSFYSVVAFSKIIAGLGSCGLGILAFNCSKDNEKLEDLVRQIDRIDTQLSPLEAQLKEMRKA